MYFVQGRPRYWVPGFDTAHLAVPALMIVVGLLITYLPARSVTRNRTVPPVPAQVMQTTILSPLAGAELTIGQTAVIEGLAQPGGIVRLYWYAQPIGEPTRVGLDGRWQFTIANLPAGTHSVRAGALVAARNIWSSEVVFTAVAPASKPMVKPAAKSGTSSKAPTKTRKPANSRP